MIQETTISDNIELKVPTTIKALIEALIFAAHEPLSISQIRTIYRGEGKQDDAQQLDADTIRKTVEELNREYEKADRPYRIVSIAGGYQFATRSEYAEWLGRLHKEQGRRKLSQSGVETLAIIAYKQPITKAEIEKIRGVNCDYVLKTLLEKELITVTGRAEAVGRPLLYGTTREFLKHFGLNDITDLPRPREIEEILGESQFETERRMLEAQAGAEAMKKEQEDFKSRLPHIPKKKADLEQKEAQIVSRKRVREIRIVPRTEAENSQQETINFQNEPVTEHAEETRQENIDSASIPIPEVTVPSQQESSLSISESVVNTQEAEAVQTENSQHETERPEAEVQVVLPESPSSVDTSETEDLPQTEEAKEETREVPAPIISEEQTTDAKGEEKVSDEIAEEYSTTEVAPLQCENNAAENSFASATPKSRWKAWKEKIQGFIRKLFD